MNREETKKAIEVMQAYVDGKEIEYCDLNPRGAWVTARTPIWNFISFGYRIKREPMEWYEVRFNSFLGPTKPADLAYRYATMVEAQRLTPIEFHDQIVKVREIIDDQD